MESETDPLIQNGSQRNYAHDDDEHEAYKTRSRALIVRATVWSVLILLFVAGLVLVFAFSDFLSHFPWSGGLPKDPELAARRIMRSAPVIDGHIDLPYVVRLGYRNNVSAVDLEAPMPLQVDIPRLRKGMVGGFFWSVFVECPKDSKDDDDFLTSSWRVRDTLEQIDSAKLLIQKYPDTFQFATGTEDIRSSIRDGKIASLMGVEGGHQLGNSIAVLRQYHALGVRYVTLTHSCHNAFADSCGMMDGIEPLHWGLSALGRKLIDEMNRLGVLVDLSHTSDDTAAQALTYSKAPVIWSHSSARAVHNVPRNVPDYVLRLIGTGKGQRDGVVMVNFAPGFVAPEGKATVKAVANHVEHIANVAGKKRVGIGSDYDGIGTEVPKGLEDVSKYPALIAELYSRGWNKYELAGLTGGNLLRVFAGAEQVSRELQESGAAPVYDLYDQRKDIPPWRQEL
ncbi:hypothetical protein SERLA73DRAFT_88074 [Serpula lacrymans var. lacrymans S7.3]|uniref:Dipeptidase n=2 Tax=Serpula lacrymans var. lacrymans TaxID=341189 RepID=F8PVZ2_SERL3|nr:uncharacterized protein SERLADRAFT_464871 [Serpula lacrymans var. lacrymans S7.9]EGN99588.1 hypothetical protein SERLA73DRAFT_88074 [Serpula lacrymans var. lacrymans S7.3]EGO25157.1 hypothetical protein SERLADRAFT_464871 [Serpula lacrymans var. lacrymans S7.9]